MKGTETVKTQNKIYNKMVLSTQETLKDEFHLIYWTTTLIFIGTVVLFFIPYFLTFIILMAYILVGWPNLEVNPQTIANFFARAVVDFGILAFGLFCATAVLSEYSMNTTIWDQWTGDPWPKSAIASVFVNYFFWYCTIIILFCAIRFTTNFLTAIGLSLRSITGQTG